MKPAPFSRQLSYKRKVTVDSVGLSTMIKTEQSEPEEDSATKAFLISKFVSRKCRPISKLSQHRAKTEQSDFSLIEVTDQLHPPKRQELRQQTQKQAINGAFYLEMSPKLNKEQKSIVFENQMRQVRIQVPGFSSSPKSALTVKHVSQTAVLAENEIQLIRKMLHNKPIPKK